MNYSATYDPADNKIRISGPRFSPEEYERVKRAGFRWAPKQQIWIAPMWTPAGADLAEELAGELTDEDTSLVDRAEDRADRFTDYSANRTRDAQAAQAGVAAIADNIPFGQPILVGHHSEKHARKDAQRIENGMRKTIKMWEQAEYWKDRAASAIHHAKYLERADVRARRIKGIEADQRKVLKSRTRCADFLQAWEKPITHDQALQIANFDHVSRPFSLADYPREAPASQYEGPMSLWSALDGGVITAEQAQEIAIRVHKRTIPHLDRWLAHYGFRLDYERAMLAEQGGTVADQTKPEKGGACKCWVARGWMTIQKVNRVTVGVLDNWGNGGADFMRTIELDKLSAVMSKTDWEACGKDPRHGTRPKQPAPVQVDTTPPEIEAMRDSLKAGVQVVSAPQLFPTPRDLAARMVGMSCVTPEMRVLEPSAGTGSILRALFTGSAIPPTQITAIEIRPALAEALRAAWPGVNVRCSDFLETVDERGFDLVLMNPPFADSADVEHVSHAYTMLAPGGRLVAIMSAGAEFRTGKKYEQFRQLVEDCDGYIEALPADTFKEAGTSVNTVLVEMWAPAAAVEPEPVPVVPVVAAKYQQLSMF